MRTLADRAPLQAHESHVLRLNQLRSKTPETNEASILALWLAWALHEQAAQQCRVMLDEMYEAASPMGPSSSERIDDGEQEAALSPWLLSEVELPIGIR